LGQSVGVQRSHLLVKFELQPVSIVKFDVKHMYKKKNMSSKLRTETGCSSRVLNVGKAFPCCYEVGAVK
jgi:hypothetical protein